MIVNILNHRRREVDEIVSQFGACVAVRPSQASELWHLDFELTGGDTIRWYAESVKIRRIHDFQKLIPLIHVGDYAHWNYDIRSIVPNWIENALDSDQAAKWIGGLTKDLGALYNAHGKFGTGVSSSPTNQTPIKAKPEKIDWLKITAETVDRS